MHSSFQTDEISVAIIVVIVLLLLSKMTFFGWIRFVAYIFKFCETCSITYYMVNDFVYVLLVNDGNTIFDWRRKQCFIYVL